MHFDWDEAKRFANLRKHGLDFLDAVTIFEGITVTVLDDRYDYGEIRYLSLGLLKGHVILVVHTEQDDVIRIISVRKATKYEEARYFEEIAN
jgi:uncharacterized DUF497 family protein